MYVMQTNIQVIQYCDDTQNVGWLVVQPPDAAASLRNYWMSMF